MEKIINEAIELIAQKEFEKAKELLEQVVSKEPENVEAIKNLGLVNINLDRFEDALDNFKKANALKEDDATSLYYLGILYSRFEENSIALENYEKLISIRPDYPNAFRNAAIASFKQNLIEKAIEYAKKALDLDIKDETTYNMLSLMYLLQDNKEEALNVLELALNNSVESFQIYKNLGKLYVVKGDFKKGIDCLEKSLAYDNDNLEVLNALSQSYQASENYLAAYETMKRVAQFDESVKKNSNFAFCAFHAKDYETAIEVYSFLLNEKNISDEDYSSYLYNLSQVYVGKGDLEKAIEALEKAREKIPNSVQIIQNLSRLNTQIGNLEKAKELLKSILNKKQTPEDIYYEYGILCAKTKDFSEAIDYLKKVTTLNPINAQAHKDLGVILLEQRLLDQAQFEFEFALKLKPDDALINFEYANYLNAIGDFRSAQVLYNKACELSNYENFEMLKYSGINDIALNDIDSAFEKLNRAYEKNDKDPKVLYNLGRIFFAKKEFLKAKEILEKAYFLSLDFDTLNLLGLVNFELENFEESKRFFEKLYKDYKNNAFLLLNLAKCSVKLGQKDDARDFLEKALNIIPEFEEAQNLLDSIK